MPMCEITIRSEGHEFLTIALFGRSHLGATDYWDGNWVTASVKVHVGGFQGSVGGDLRAEELAAFRAALVVVEESLRGVAEFTTMEEWLLIRVEGDRRGHMVCRCVLRDEPGIGNTLTCTLASDQTFIRSTVTELSAAVRAFPVIGRP
jgi:hypothetical protein